MSVFIADWSVCVQCLTDTVTDFDTHPAPICLVLRVYGVFVKRGSTFRVLLIYDETETSQISRTFASEDGESQSQTPTASRRNRDSKNRFNNIFLNSQILCGVLQTGVEPESM